MGIIDRLKQKIEESHMRKIKLKEDILIKKVISENATKEEIIEGFEKSVDKKTYLQKIDFFVNDDVINALEEKVKELCINDKNFLINEMPYCIGKMNKNEIKEIIKSQLGPLEIISNTELFSIFGYTGEQLDLLKSVKVELISTEILESLPQDIRETFIKSIKSENVTIDMINLTSEEFRISLAQEYIIDNSVKPEYIKKLFSQDILLNSEKKIIQKNASLLNNRCLQFIPSENKGEMLALAKMHYVLQRLEKNKLKNVVEKKNYDLVQKMVDNKDFIKYLEYRQNNFNMAENNVELKTSKKEIIEILSSIKEYQNNSQLIDEFLKSDMINDKKMKLILKYYILDTDETKKEILNINELSEYPNDVLKRQKELISDTESKKRENLMDIIVKNLTGFSFNEYQNYTNMFLESHDIEEVLEANNDKQKIINLKVVKDIIESMELKNDTELEGLAINFATRNYKELTTGEFSLVELRERYKTFISNIKSEYGKEFNKSMGYTIKQSEIVEVEGKTINVHQIEGQFKVLASACGSIGLENTLNSNKDMVCTSFLGEGHYGMYRKAINGERFYLLYDKMPEEFLYASANHDIGSNDNGDKKSNFMTAENTIQNVKGIQDEGIYTEQDYVLEGFNKDGEFMKIYPIALGTFEERPSEQLLKVAAKYDKLDIIIIPEMQKNLQNMLEKEIITPGLVKGINGFSDRIIQILDSKEILSKEENLALKVLKQKERDETILNQIEKLLEKPIEKDKKDIAELVDDINVSQINEIVEETKQKFLYNIKSTEVGRGE